MLEEALAGEKLFLRIIIVILRRFGIQGFKNRSELYLINLRIRFIKCVIRRNFVKMKPVIPCRLYKRYPYIFLVFS
jgi:hypothetical protein